MSETLLERVRRRALRARVLGPLLEAFLRRQATLAVGTVADSSTIVAAVDAAPLLPAGTLVLDQVYGLRDMAPIQLALLRVDRLNEVDARLLAALVEGFGCVYRNGLYAVFRRGHPTPATASSGTAALIERMRRLTDPAQRGWALHHPGLEPSPPRPAEQASGGVSRAAFLTTFDRPAALQRTLPQVCALGIPVVVVDDGSSPAAREANRKTCERLGVALLALPANRGLPAAMNAGLAYLLADPRISWISYFQDDVDVSPALVQSLAAAEDAAERPLLTGYDAPEHPTVDVVWLDKLQIKRKRSTAAVHLHAHASYWTSVSPIPSPYLGAPKPRVGASMEDWWIASQAPLSVGKRGLYVACLPGLVTTFLSHRDDSTWDNPADPS